MDSNPRPRPYPCQMETQREGNKTWAVGSSTLEVGRMGEAYVAFPLAKLASISQAQDHLCH